MYMCDSDIIVHHNVIIYKYVFLNTVYTKTTELFYG